MLKSVVKCLTHDIRRKPTPYSVMVRRTGGSPGDQTRLEVNFSGDNPASFVGMGVSKGDIVVSLGSSDTLLMWVDKNTPPLLEGHLLANPMDPDYLMGMLCFKNGSLMRDRIAEECAGGQSCLNIFFKHPRVSLTRELRSGNA